MRGGKRGRKKEEEEEEEEEEGGGGGHCRRDRCEEGEDEGADDVGALIACFFVEAGAYWSGGMDVVEV